MVLGKLGSHMQKNETRRNLTPCPQINSKWIKDLPISPETPTKLLDGMSTMAEGRNRKWVAGHYDCEV